METVKIAVVDDHKLFRQGLVQILSRYPQYRIVLEASSGKELLDKLDSNIPDVVLLDLHMADLDGKEVSIILLKKYPSIKIIVLSMNYSHEAILQMTRIGVHGYLPKDIDQTILHDAIEQVSVKGFYINEEVALIFRQGLISDLNMKNSRTKITIEPLNINLTAREIEVLQLICRGFNTSQVADELFISYRTVEGHRKNLLEKTGSNNSVSLALFAVQHNLINVN